MADVILTRFLYTRDATFGVMHQGDLPLCVTVERPWLQNKKQESCIMTGVYKCVPHTSEKYKNVWRLLDVPGREGILIHIGNNAKKDSTGCILPGVEFYKDQPGVGRSREALDFLRMVLPRNFTLEIRDFQSQSAGPALSHIPPKGPSP